VKIALVGFTDSYNDQRWLEIAGAWVARHALALAWASATREVFDLRGKHGSNFLDDSGSMTSSSASPSTTRRRRARRSIGRSCAPADSPV
jgi:hypothetical protein